MLRLFRIRQRPLVLLPLAFILGVAVASMLPFLLELLHCPLYKVTVFGTLGGVCFGLNAGWVCRGGAMSKAVQMMKESVRTLRVRIYELPAILVLTFMVFVSVWRCYYLPPTSRDALSGPEAIAEYAVREHTLINSFFTMELSTTNNQFKSPYLTDLQVIYKMAGYPFGQVWLSVVFVGFILLVYQLLKVTLHPILAGVLLILLMMTPEAYGYTFMILYDYSNMVFLFLSLYFFIGYFEKKDNAFFYFGALLMGIATYIRSETLVLAVLFTPALWVMQLRAKYTYTKTIGFTVLFMLPAVVSYYLTVRLYITNYLPVHYDISTLVNPHPFDLRPLFRQYKEIITELVVSEFGIRLWGYFMYVWAALFLAELLILRRFSRAARNWLYAIGVVFAGLGLLGFLLPLFDIPNTTKRGLLKILPLMVMYMANNQLLIKLSARISRWESGGRTGHRSEA